ncbi:MAG TPA: branched-chain amino acid ABC transporter permease, partial [Actinomycetota bacterium]
AEGEPSGSDGRGAAEGEPSGYDRDSDSASGASVIYREAGQFKSSYASDQAVFPIRQDRVVLALALVAAVIAVPLVAEEYWLQAVLIPFLIYSLAALGLNLLTGYAGQVSLGTGGFMAVGAYAAFKLTSAFPRLNVLVAFLLAGLITALVGLLFGLPSLRIKGFYLAVATLAAQFFLLWLFNKVAWFTDYASSGTITAPPRTVAGIMVTGPAATAPVRYLTALALVALFALIAKNLVRGRVGRSWMAIRDRDIAAEIIGVRPLRTKLLAFAISSFFIGVAGAEYVFLYLGSAETLAFDINVSFLVLFMVIIGGLGSILGSFLGSAFIVMVPIFLTNVPHLLGLAMPVALQKQIELMVFGGLIIFFLIAEPHGLARLWQIGKEKLRLWPFPY